MDVEVLKTLVYHGLAGLFHSGFTDTASSIHEQGCRVDWICHLCHGRFAGVPGASVVMLASIILQNKYTWYWIAAPWV